VDVVRSSLLETSKEEIAAVSSSTTDVVAAATVPAPLEQTASRSSKFTPSGTSWMPSSLFDLLMDEEESEPLEPDAQRIDSKSSFAVETSLDSLNSSAGFKHKPLETMIPSSVNL
jgi:hypothetical protein